MQPAAAPGHCTTPPSPVLLWAGRRRAAGVLKQQWHPSPTRKLLLDSLLGRVGWVVVGVLPVLHKTWKVAGDCRVQSRRETGTNNKQQQSSMPEANQRGCGTTGGGAGEHLAARTREALAASASRSPCAICSRMPSLPCEQHRGRGPAVRKTNMWCMEGKWKVTDRGLFQAAASHREPPSRVWRFNCTHLALNVPLRAPQLSGLCPRHVRLALRLLVWRAEPGRAGGEACAAAAAEERRWRNGEAQGTCAAWA
jgi:hypothetical protein